MINAFAGFSFILEKCMVQNANPFRPVAMPILDAIQTTIPIIFIISPSS
jgi:hypothetical protein